MKKIQEKQAHSYEEKKEWKTRIMKIKRSKNKEN